MNKNSTIAKPLEHKEKANKFDILSFVPFLGRDNTPVVAVLRLDGVIGKSSRFKTSLNLAGLAKNIEKAFKIKNLIAVCLQINSPGGSPVQCDLIAKRISMLAEKENIPVYSFIEDVAASGGYWLACVGEEIYASRSSVIGSIGVVARGFGMHEAIKKLGIERRVYTQGKNKSILDPFEPAKANDVKIIKKLQKEVHQHFIDHVKTSRRNRVTQSDELIYNGEFWTGQTALDYGLIDGIDDMYNFIDRRFDDEVKIEIIEQKPSWLAKRLGLDSLANDHADRLVTNIESKIEGGDFPYL